MDKNPFIISDTNEILKSAWSKRTTFRDLVIKKRNPKHTNNQTKLTDVFTEFPFGLPHGIVAKEETGMGATTLEILAKRNSIIVEPIKITASSKANEFGKLYVGSPTKNFHPNKITDEEILDYLKSDVEFKKIIVVADSLGRVIKAIQKLSTLVQVELLPIENDRKDIIVRKVKSIKLNDKDALNKYFLLTGRASRIGSHRHSTSPYIL